MNRSPLRYAPWMVRDFLRGPGVLMLGAIVLASLIVSRLVIAGPDSGLVSPDGAMSGILAQLSWPFVLLATGGMVSTDRVQGYYREIFSKPVRPATHYLIRWLVGAVAVGGSMPLIWAGVALGPGRPRFEWSLLINLELTYLLLGGLVFLLSTLFRWDWTPALTMFAVEEALGSALEHGFELPWAARWVAAALPPFHLANVTSPVPRGMDLVRVLLWGAALVAAAVWVLRVKPMGSGGRA
ncbi:MAG: hypothetical protein ACOY71_06330 [Gemmatimonadota bacterium]